MTDHKENPIVFFCMEYAVDDDPNAYAGGLGILAGDYLLEAADRNLPVIAIGLRYGNNHENLTDMNIIIDIPIGQEVIKVKVWERSMKDSVRLLLLDANISENIEENRELTSFIYDSHFYTRIKQQMILGIGGVRLSKSLNVNPNVYHLNEGHTSFAALAVIAEDRGNKQKIIATKHTIFSNAGTFIPKNDFEGLVGPYCKLFGLNTQKVFDLGRFEKDTDMFSTTKFLMTVSKIRNGVSLLHTTYEKKVHPLSDLIPITNGVYKKRWQALEWGNDPQNLPDAEYEKIKKILKSRLISFVREKTGNFMNPNACTVVWARRFAAYKRPSLLFSDLGRLEKIVNDEKRPIQFIFSGKSYPTDEEGKGTIEKINEISRIPAFKDKIAYLPGYSITTARYLIQGADIWLNTPELGREACGTSGIKASLNGALQLSVADGWVYEVDWQKTGWILREESIKEDLYKFLESEVSHEFYSQNSLNPSKNWLKRMKATMSVADPYFTTGRMIDDYIEKIYSSCYN